MPTGKCDRYARADRASTLLKRGLDSLVLSIVNDVAADFHDRKRDRQICLPRLPIITARTSLARGEDISISSSPRAVSDLERPRSWVATQSTTHLLIVCLLNASTDSNGTIVRSRRGYRRACRLKSGIVPSSVYSRREADVMTPLARPRLRERLATECNGIKDDMIIIAIIIST